MCKKLETAKEGWVFLLVASWDYLSDGYEDWRCRSSPVWLHPRGLHWSTQFFWTEIQIVFSLIGSSVQVLGLAVNMFYSQVHSGSLLISCDHVVQDTMSFFRWRWRAWTEGQRKWKSLSKLREKLLVNLALSVMLLPMLVFSLSFWVYLFICQVQVDFLVCEDRCCTQMFLKKKVSSARYAILMCVANMLQLLEHLIGHFHNECAYMYEWMTLMDEWITDQNTDLSLEG